MLPRPMSLEQFGSVQEGPRYFNFNVGPNLVILIIDNDGQMLPFKMLLGQMTYWQLSMIKLDFTTLLCIQRCGRVPGYWWWWCKV